MPALHALLVFELDGQAKEYRKDLKSSLGFQLWDRYIAAGALFGGSLLPPLLVNGAPKAYLVNFLPNGKFVYSLRNMGICECSRSARIHESLIICVQWAPVAL